MPLTPSRSAITGGVGLRNPSPALTGVPTAPTGAVGDNTTQIATDAFVTTAIANAVAGVNPAAAVQAATAAILPNSPTYNNGASGIGAFITTATTNATLVVDGYTPVLNDRILVKNESGGLGAGKNGVYFVSQVAALGLAWILVRSLDYDQPSDINNTGAIPVINGTANATTQWVLSSAITAVDGTQALTYAQFSYAPSSIALLASPAFTGTPTAPTAAASTNTTQIATTAFVQAQGGVAPKLFFQTVFSGTTGAVSGGPTQNKINLCSFYLPYPITISNIGYDVTSADNTPSNYDLGIYGPGALGGAANIPLVCHTGTTAGTVLAPSTGFKKIALTGAPITLQPGYYAWAITSSSVSPTAVFGGATTAMIFLPWAETQISGGGATLPSTITAPATSVAALPMIFVSLF
jgi:hypothetical protein